MSIAKLEPLQQTVHKCQYLNEGEAKNEIYCCVYLLVTEVLIMLIKSSSINGIVQIAYFIFG